MHLESHIDKRLRQIKRGNIRIIHHFKIRPHGRICIIDCWCGTSFATDYIDRHDLERMNAWYDEHAACPPKGQP